uniref:Putative P1 n=1 Tax=Suaeda polerovirus A TaxID=2593980 RepID=A0A7G3W8M9_9VIRU|nr:putative P1 [Suaeda polerovirus A]
MKILFVTFSLVCLCSLVSSFQGTTSTSPGAANVSNWHGILPDVAPLCPPPIQLIYKCPQEKTLRDFSSREMQQEILARAFLNARHAYTMAKTSLINSFQSGLTTTSASLKHLLHYVLKSINYVWSSCLLALVYAIWFLLREYTIEMLIMTFLCLFTAFMARLVAWIFGDLPIFLLSYGLTILRGTLRALWSRKSYKEEMSVEGFLSFTIPQSPPKNSVLQIQHKDGSHAGYATCVLLFNGSTGLVTAKHVINPGSKVVSTRNGNKIPVSEFKNLFDSESRDMMLMAGPPNWEGTLACKAAIFQTAPSLCKSKASFYSWNGDNWESSNAEIVGTSSCKRFVSVLSNTDHGHSGTPYFNGKTMLGVHVGGAKNENVNYISPIPPVPGLTTPIYVFETTAPQGKLFSDDEIAALVEEFSWSEVESIMKNRKQYEMESQPPVKVTTLPTTVDEEDIEYDPFPDSFNPPTKVDEEDIEYDPFPDSFEPPVKPYIEETTSKGNDNAAASAITTVEENGTTPCAKQNNGGKTPQLAAPSIQRELLRPSTEQDTYMPPHKKTNQDASARSPTMTASIETMSEIKEAILNRVDLRSIEKQVVEILADKAMKKPRRKRGRRSSRNKQNSSDSISPPSTHGAMQTSKQLQDSKMLGSSHSFITLNKRADRTGDQKSVASTQKWRPSQKGLGGPSSAQKLN